MSGRNRVSGITRIGVISIVSFLLALPLAAQQPGTIRGTVREAGTAAALGNVTVRIIGSPLNAISSSDGAFTLTPVPAGIRIVEAELLGYASARDTITVRDGETIDVELMLERQVIALADVVVTPGHFGIAYERVSRPQTLTRAQIETLPQLGDDLFRAVNRLPGMGSHDFSARFTVRGGDDESVLVLLDGLELFEPYHLKDFDGSLSILDVAAIGSVDLTTGGYSAAHGNHLTGVFDLRTSNLLTTEPRTQLALSLNNVRVLSQGSFAQDKGLWLFSARRGYLDIVLDLAGQDADMDPRYYDALGKVVYQLTPRHRMSVHALRAGDALTLRDDDGNGLLTSRYGSTYGWTTIDSRITDIIDVQTRISVGNLDWKRDAAENENERNGQQFEIRDDRDLTFAGLRQDWQFELNDRLLLRTGFEVTAVQAAYDYFKFRRDVVVQNGSVRTSYDTTRVDLSPDGTERAVWVVQRMQPWRPLTVEAGVRYDQQSVTDDDQWSPRVNAAWSITERTTLRAGWGRYAQPQRLHQLNVQDGEAEFSTAERAEQIVAGIEHDLRGVRLRAEAYRRNESNLRARYLNLTGSIEPVAEVEGDRYRAARTAGRAQGIELMAQQMRTTWSWSASYALARAEDEIDGDFVPRPLEQRHTFYFDQSFTPRARWRVSWSWQYHTGWPITESTFTLDSVGGGTRLQRTFGPYHAARLPAYHRMDVRVSRDIALRSGRLNIFVDVFNLYNRDNPQGYEYIVNVSNERIAVRRSLEPMLPVMPSLGLMWEF
jgi:hypothetical protein